MGWLRKIFGERVQETAASAPRPPKSSQPKRRSEAPLPPDVFVDGAKIGDIVIEVRDIAALHVPSGRIVACDPLVFFDAPPFTRAIPIGSHPVRISIAHLPNGDERIAAAIMRCDEATPTSWEMALLPGQDVGSLDADEFFGYPVDAGLGCFMDEESAQRLARRMKQEREREGSNYYDDVLAAEMEPTRKNTHDWADHRPSAGEPHNVIIFSSGWGDGFYATWFGMAGEAPCCVVTDFGVVASDDGRGGAADTGRG